MKKQLAHIDKGTNLLSPDGEQPPSDLPFDFHAFACGADAGDNMFIAWQNAVQKLENEEISKEEYDAWRYSYPRGGGRERKITKPPAGDVNNRFRPRQGFMFLKIEMS